MKMITRRHENIAGRELSGALAELKRSERQAGKLSQIPSGEIMKKIKVYTCLKNRGTVHSGGKDNAK